MRRLAMAVIMLLFAGCAPQYPLNANLNLQIISQVSGVYDGTAKAAIEGRDSRENPEVLVYQLTDGAAVRITNLSPPHILVSERLAGGMREQGLRFESSAPVKIIVDLKELVATVTRPKILYMTQATSRIHLMLDNNGTTLSKNYNLQSKRESVARPKVDEMEALLDTQLTDIVAQILDDKNIQRFIRGE